MISQFIAAQTRYIVHIQHSVVTGYTAVTAVRCVKVSALLLVHRVFRVWSSDRCMEETVARGSTTRQIASLITQSLMLRLRAMLARTDARDYIFVISYAAAAAPRICRGTARLSAVKPTGRQTGAESLSCWNHLP